MFLFLLFLGTYLDFWRDVLLHATRAVCLSVPIKSACFTKAYLTPFCFQIHLKERPYLPILKPQSGRIYGLQFKIKTTLTSRPPLTIITGSLYKIERLTVAQPSSVKLYEKSSRLNKTCNKYIASIVDSSNIRPKSYSCPAPSHWRLHTSSVSVARLDLLAEQ